MLVAMVNIAAVGDAGPSPAVARTTLPRHLHRFVLRLLRPAEAATRRLIIIAARGLVVTLPPLRPRKAKPKREARTILVLDRVNGSIVSVPIVLPGQEHDPIAARPVPRALSFALFDPLRRFEVRRRYSRASTMPRIRSFDDQRGGRRPDPPPIRLSSADDPLDAGRLHRRLEMIGRALDDLPGQANRLARWQARRDAAWRAEREDGNAVNDHGAGDGATAETARAGRSMRFQRMSPIRPGRPPGWRRKSDHQVYDVLNELHGLAVWARERRDSS
ncbi:MAG: hypothetical protein ABW213_16540 [Tardiphaga sp.]